MRALRYDQAGHCAQSSAGGLEIPRIVVFAALMQIRRKTLTQPSPAKAGEG